MASAPVGVGLIGFGRIAELFHCKLLAHMPSVRLLAIAEQDEDRLKIAGRTTPEATLYQSYTGLLTHDALDAVVICLPPSLHAQVAVDALQAHKHIYLEKPLALNLQEAQNLIKVWKQSKQIGMIGFNYRFHPVYRRAREIIAAEQFGALVGARTVFSAKARSIPTWKQRRETGGGVLLDLASHHFDLISFLFEQPIVYVTAATASQRSEDDNAVVQLTLKSGALVSSFFSMTAGDEHRMELYFERARLVIDRSNPFGIEVIEHSERLARVKRLGRGLRALHPRALLTSPGYEPSFSAALAHFISAVGAHQSAKPDLGDGYQAQRLIAAAEEAARKGQAVSVGDVDQPYSETSDQIIVNEPQ